MIRKAEKKDITDLALLRSRLIKDSFSSLGSAFLLHYYFPLFLYSPQGVLWVYQDENDQIQGYIAGSCDFQKMKFFLNFTIIIGLIKILFCIPLKIFGLFTQKNTNNLNIENGGKLSSMAVSPSCQGKGIGNELVKVLLKKLKDQDNQFCYLHCKKNNISAQTLYKKNGFEIKRHYIANNTEYTILLSKL